MFGKKLKLWLVEANGYYCGGSYLIAAIDQAGVDSIVERLKKENDDFNDWTVEKQEGQIIGVEPGVIHSYSHR
jgi:hypothetical protein